MSTWRESCGCGTVPSMTSNCSPWPDLCCVSLCRDMALKFAEHEGILHDSECYDAFTDIESMIGAALRIQ